MRFESTSSRVASSGARRSISASNVRLESSISAHSSPSKSPSTRRGSFPSSSSPSESARRFAGSIVTTATLRPRSAIPIASAAAVVVLPTPPGPAQTTMRRPSRTSSTLSAYADRLALDVGDRDVDGAAPAAADADLERHLHLAHRLREQVPALDAHVVVGPVGAEHRAGGVLLDRGATVWRDFARADPPHHHPRHQSFASFPVKSVISASSTPATTPSPIEAALPVI